MNRPERSSRAHPHPPPPRADRGVADVLVVGGGHAGIEAASAAARVGASVVLISFRADKIGEMSCNPAIGGLGKGQLVREVDALGGVMGAAADRTGIQFKMLGTGKGPASQGPRCQSDRHLYREDVTRVIASTPNVRVVEGAADGFLVDTSGERGRVRGVRLADGRELAASAVVVTTGTFLRAVMHTGEAQSAGGRIGEGTSGGLSAEMQRLGVELGRLKTGTPPRLDARSIEWARLEPERGDAQPTPFSFATDRKTFPALTQIACFVTWTNARTHELIRANIHRAPMYAGRIHGVGPRYCPSVEDKVMRFADKERHQIFLEPESLSTDVVYANGISTSLPAEVQEELVHSIEGLERARFLRHGYAVEYDFALPAGLDPTLASLTVPGLFLAGQINGTSGYEEAAAQGLIAGANAALWASDRAPFVLGRHEAYLGVLVDDLVISRPVEPYRMFTSRAEHRLLLRADNADRRLVRLGHSYGLVGDAALRRLAAREERIAAAQRVLASVRAPEWGHRTLAEVLKRPEVRLGELVARHAELAALELDLDDATAVEVDAKYAGYIAREERDVERLRHQEDVEIPLDLDYASLAGLANEARAKLAAQRPRTLGAASRIAGVRPPDVALLAVHLARRRRERKS
ncbi:MAG: tRNA uridine-5-carboxymethylaminomethyl(34) synthesis enzyme MnmG [Planctomycetes bacterium]|nr:tRNA uridine-5-carboxymethylaminomethyl(34) synthesis enzyme MnmG [Planctomycetota bacterium]